MSQLPLVSADSHVNEPPWLWRDRVPASLRDRAPRVERFDQGEAWVLEGALDPINFGGNCAAGVPAEERSAWITWDQVPAAGYEPEARLAAQDRDGVVAEVLYPTPRLGNQLFWHREDRALHLACIQAYNDWLAELCAHAPDRFWGVAMLPTTGVAGAAAEAERAIALPGLRGVMIGRYPHGGTEPAPEDDAVWGLLAEAGVPLSVHVSFALEAQGDKRRSKLRGDTRFYDAPVRIAQFIESGTFDRFPALALVMAEVDSSWLPYLAEQMDDRFKRAAPANRADLELTPGAYFARNIWSTFITDTYGIRNRHEIGVERMMWSSDYPHGGSDWPRSHEVLDEALAGVPDDERHALVEGNARGLYGVDVPAASSVR
jgi:predicted TIM-barrel fold metal-dependent hydrolase